MAKIFLQTAILHTKYLFILFQIHFNYFRENKTDVLDLPFYVLVRCSHFRKEERLQTFAKAEIQN